MYRYPTEDQQDMITCSEGSKWTWLLNNRAASTDPWKVLWYVTAVNSQLVPPTLSRPPSFLPRGSNRTGEEMRTHARLWVRGRGGMVKKCRTEMPEQLELWRASLGQKKGNSTWQQMRLVVTLTFRSYYLNVKWNMFSWVSRLFLCPQVCNSQR